MPRGACAVDDYELAERRYGHVPCMGADDDLAPVIERRDEMAESKPAFERPPIQPVFKIWPRGLWAMALPVIGLVAGWVVATVLGTDFFAVPAAGTFFAVLCGGNAFTLSEAIGLEQSHKRFAVKSAAFEF